MRSVTTTTHKPPTAVQHAKRPSKRHAVPAAVALVACLALAGTAWATVVGGRLGTGRAAAPGLRVYAWSRASGHLYSLGLGTATTWSLDLPPGRYWLFAGLEGAGAPPIYAAYTEYSRCLHHAPAASCDGHQIAEVEVGSHRLADIDLTDWALSDDSANAIDNLLGRPPVDPYDESGRAAPKFSEYPVRAADVPSVSAREASGYHEADREAAQAALGEPPNYAGQHTLVPVGCGQGCNGIAIVDHVSGAVRYPPALNPLPEPPTCESRPVLQYRRDSRLLVVTSAAGKGGAAGTLVHYYTYEAGRADLNVVATRPGSEPAGSLHCAPGERAGR